MMLTRCPACNTTFRVTPEQLKVRAGRVRCGHCNAVFDALESLQDSSPAVAVPPPAAEGTSAPALTGEAAVQPVKAQEVPPAISQSAAATAGAGLPPEARAALEETAAAPRRAATYAWGAGGLLALLLLIGQLVYFFRAELALARPDWRPQLEEFCRRLECEIPLPRKADLVSIEASDLYPEPQRKNLLVLSATLKNRAPFVQEYPHLELTLTDAHDQPMIRRVFPPAEYLAEAGDARAGFPANGEAAVSLWLDAGSIDASGYRLYLFYP